MRHEKSRRAAILVGIAGIIVLAAVPLVYRDELRLRWICRQAQGELAREEFSPTETPPNVAALFEAGPDGYPYLAELLRSPEYPVWTNLTYLVDKRLEVETRRSFVDRLRRTDVLALVRYLLIEPYDADTRWREDLSPLSSFSPTPVDPSEAACRGYWSGRPTGVLDASEAATEFLASVLDRDIGYEGDELYRHRFEMRAVSALGCMIPPRAPNGPGDSPIAKILARVAKQHDEIEVSLYAAHRLLQSSEATHSSYYRRLQDWELFAVGSRRQLADLEAGDRFPLEGDRARSVYPLAFIGDARGFDVLLRIWKLGVLTREFWESLPVDNHGLPLDLTTRKPDAAHAHRLLEGDTEARTIAVGALAILDDRASIAVLRDIAENAESKTLRAHAMASLLALGEDVDWKEIRKRFVETFERWFAEIFLPPGSGVRDLPTELTPFVFARDGLEDGTTTATWPHIDSEVGGFVGRWRVSLNPATNFRCRRKIADLAHALCASGRRETLDTVVDYFLHTATDSTLRLYVSRFANRAFRLEDYLDIPALDSVPGARSAGSTGAEYRHALRTWWTKHGEHLVWNPEERRWTSTHTDE